MTGTKYENRMKELREISGEVTYNDPLTAFLYDLMRDHLPAGNVEKMVQEIISGPDECVFTNGWLAKYAHNLAEQLRGGNELKLKRDLLKAFDDAEYARNVLSSAEKASGATSPPPSEEMEDKILKELKEELDAIPDAGEEVKDVVDHIKDSIKDLVASGMVGEDEAEKLVQDLDELETEIIDEPTETASEEESAEKEEENCEGDCGDNCCKETNQDCCKGE